MRSLVIDDILSGGENISTEYYPGSFRAIGSKYKANGVAVSNVWKTFCQMGENLLRHAAAKGQPKRLAEPKLDLVQPLINVDLRELTWALINSFDFYNRPCCPRPFPAEGKMTWKKMMKPAGKNFTPDNKVGYLNRV